MLDSADFTRGRLRARVIALLTETPEPELHTREVIRRTQASPRAVQVALEQLARQGIVRSRRLGNLRLWSLARDNPLLRPLQELAKRTVGVPGRLMDLLSRVTGLDLAFIYGSYALGTEDAASDIDVFVLGQPNWKTLAGVLNELRRELGREVNVVAWTTDQLRESRTTPFYRSLVRGPKIWLIGEEGNLERYARRVAGQVQRRRAGGKAHARRRTKQTPARRALLGASRSQSRDRCR